MVSSTEDVYICLAKYEYSFYIYFRENVRLIQLQLDPEGVALRKKRRLKRRQYSNKVM